MNKNCAICGPSFIGTCVHGSGETYPVMNLVSTGYPKKEAETSPISSEIKKLKEQNRIMFEALDKINDLDHKHLCDGPHIAADVLDIVHPIVGGE